MKTKKFMKTLVFFSMITLPVRAEPYEIINNTISSIGTSAVGSDYKITQSGMLPYILTVKKKKAIIVAGTDSHDFNKDNIWKATQLCIEYAYNALIFQGYTKENIYFLSPENLDFDGNGNFDDVDGKATHTNLEYAIEAWASDTKELLLYMIDHGGFGTFQINADVVLKAENLDSSLDSLQMSMPGRVIFIYDACKSGSFITLLKPPTGKERIVITSTSQDQSAYFLENGIISFSYMFWSIIYKPNPANLATAYSGAEYSMKHITKGPYQQLALVDANGNGIAEADDKTLLNNIVIGNKESVFADNNGKRIVNPNDVPNITEVCESQILYGETSEVLWARVIDSDISKVWAIITPPDFDPEPSDKPVTDLPSVELTDPDEDAIYEGVYEGFTHKGIYKIAFHAIDKKGFHSPPIEKISIEQTIPILHINNDGFANLTYAIIRTQAVSRNYRR